MKNFSFKQVLVLMLMLFSIFIGSAEYAAQAESNDNLGQINSQKTKLAQIEKDVSELQTETDKSQASKDQLLRELYPVEVALNHGFNKEVGFTLIQECKRNGIRSSFIMGVIESESTWRNLPPNEATATGLMQVTTHTGASLARDLGITNYSLQDPVVNIKLGTYYLACLIRKYGDVHSALTAYNQGEGGLQQYVAYYGTSRSGYSRKVISYQEHYENQ